LPEPRPQRRARFLPYTTLFRANMPFSSDAATPSGSRRFARFSSCIATSVAPSAGVVLAFAPGDERLGYGLLAAIIGLACIAWSRSQEHASELQSRENPVCRLLL